MLKLNNLTRNLTLIAAGAFMATLVEYLIWWRWRRPTSSEPVMGPALSLLW